MNVYSIPRQGFDMFGQCCDNGDSHGPVCFGRSENDHSVFKVYLLPFEGCHVSETLPSGVEGEDDHAFPFRRQFLKHLSDFFNSECFLLRFLKSLRVGNFDSEEWIFVDDFAVESRHECR